MAELGGPSAAARAVGTSDTHLIACGKGRRNIGDDLATRLERKAGKPLGWMDEDRRSGWPFQGIARERFDALDSEQRIEVQGVVRRMIVDFEAFPPRAANDSRPAEFVDTASYKGDDRRHEK